LWKICIVYIYIKKPNLKFDEEGVLNINKCIALSDILVDDNIMWTLLKKIKFLYVSISFNKLAFVNEFLELKYMINSASNGNLYLRITGES